MGTVISSAGWSFMFMDAVTRYRSGWAVFCISHHLLWPHSIRSVVPSGSSDEMMTVSGVNKESSVGWWCARKASQSRCPEKRESMDRVLKVGVWVLGTYPHIRFKVERAMLSLLLLFMAAASWLKSVGVFGVQPNLISTACFSCSMSDD